MRGLEKKIFATIMCKELNTKRLDNIEMQLNPNIVIWKSMVGVQYPNLSTHWHDPKKVAGNRPCIFCNGLSTVTHS